MTITFLEHTADLKFRAAGKTKEEVFEEVVRALSTYISEGRESKGALKKKLVIEGKDLCTLLYTLIDELIFLLDTQGFLTNNAEITFTKKGLEAELNGEDARKHNVRQVKAATYSEMYINNTGKGWEAQVVVDI